MNKTQSRILKNNKRMSKKCENQEHGILLQGLWFTLKYVGISHNYYVCISQVLIQSQTDLSLNNLPSLITVITLQDISSFQVLLGSTVNWFLRLKEAQAGIKMAGRNINNLRYSDDTTLMGESEEEIKSLLMKVKEEWKSWLKTQHSENNDHGTRSHRYFPMARRWGNNGNSDRLYFWGLQNHCRWWLQSWN